MALRWRSYHQCSSPIGAQRHQDTIRRTSNLRIWPEHLSWQSASIDTSWPPPEKDNSRKTSIHSLSWARPSTSNPAQRFQTEYRKAMWPLCRLLPHPQECLYRRVGQITSKPDYPRRDDRHQGHIWHFTTSRHYFSYILWHYHSRMQTMVAWWIPREQSMGKRK